MRYAIYNEDDQGKILSDVAVDALIDLLSALHPGMEMSWDGDYDLPYVDFFFRDNKEYDPPRVYFYEDQVRDFLLPLVQEYQRFGSRSMLTGEFSTRL
jgi:hypothetical protein